MSSPAYQAIVVELVILQSIVTFASLNVGNWRVRSESYCYQRCAWHDNVPTIDNTLSLIKMTVSQCVVRYNLFTQFSY
jgi:hypothetical protein